MTHSPLRRLARLAPAAVFLCACHHAPAAVATTPAPAPVRQAGMNADSAARARRDSLARAAAREDSIRRAAEEARLAAANARQAITAPIHFEFDHAEIEASDQALLDRKAAIMTANRGLQLRIEGNADERGSDEYNLALGMRRAAVARRYLAEHGVDTSRLSLVSNGEEHPVCQDHDESCWQQNRRDEFVITAGGDRLTAMR